MDNDCFSERIAVLETQVKNLQAERQTTEQAILKILSETLPALAIKLEAIDGKLDQLSESRVEGLESRLAAYETKYAELNARVWKVITALGVLSAGGVGGVGVLQMLGLG